MYALAYKYLTKDVEWFLVDAFSILNRTPFTPDKWKEKASKAFARKISDAVNNE